MSHQKILILDFGSQVTQLIARRVREAKVFCEIHPYDVSDDFIRNYGAQGIILSGGPSSVTEGDTPRAPSVAPPKFHNRSRFSTVPRSRSN